MGEKLRAQYADYCDDDGIIILAQTHCFGQMKNTDTGMAIVFVVWDTVLLLYLPAIKPKRPFFAQS